MRRIAKVFVYLGIGLAVGGFGLMHASEHRYEYVTDSRRFAMSALFIGILSIAAYGSGLPDLHRQRRSGALSAVAAVISSALIISLIQLFTGDQLLPRTVVIGASITLIPWFSLCASLANGAATRAERRDRVVLVSDKDEADDLREELSNRPERPAQLVSVLSIEEAQSWGSREQPVCSAVGSLDASILVLARKAQLEEGILAQAAAVHSSGTRVRTLHQFYEEWLGKLPISELERMALLFDISEIHVSRYRPVKRLLDVAAACVGSLFLTAILPFVLLGNLVANRGSLLYRQKRLGKNGQPFEILKFRTMKTDDDRSTEWTQEDDSRITPFGRYLRRSHLDELPQVFNILRGDLSIVGPRPEQPHYVAELSKSNPFYFLRHLVRPGVTGWAQVNCGYAGSEEDAFQKLQYEFYYLRHQSLRLDLRIMGRTIRSVVGRGGR